MIDLTSINRSVNRIMDKYISERGYVDSVTFESKMMVSQDSVMFTLTHQRDIVRTELFKAVFSTFLMSEMLEDTAVNLICSTFKTVIEGREKTTNKDKKVPLFQAINI